MAYRNGTYVAFHAEGTNRPGQSDIDYYNLMRAWSAKTDDDFTLINSHEKASAVRDSSRKETLKASLLERLRNSKNMLLIIGQTTRLDTDWIPFEIEKAVDYYKLPVIAAYTGYTKILKPAELSSLWPKALLDRIERKTVRAIHIPFKKLPIMDAIDQFNVKSLPKAALSHYTKETYEGWGMD